MRAFSPLDRRLNIPPNKITPRVVRQMLETVAQDDYRASARSVAVLGNQLSAATVGRLVREEGERLQTELFGPQASLAAAQGVKRKM